MFSLTLWHISSRIGVGYCLILDFLRQQGAYTCSDGGYLTSVPYPILRYISSDDGVGQLNLLGNNFSCGSVVVFFQVLSERRVGEGGG